MLLNKIISNYIISTKKSDRKLINQNIYG